jgi:predicted Zn finger-like uncharacterized protein
MLCRATRPIAKRRVHTQDQAVGYLMRIVCPACETAYDVPDGVLVPGRALRCARCRSEWLPVSAPPPDIEAAPIPDTASVNEPAVPPPTPSLRIEPASEGLRPPGPRVAVIAGWLLSLLLLVGLGYAAVTWRQPIEQAWPPSTRAYTLLGYS